MEKHVANPENVDRLAREKFYHLVGQSTASEAAWAERQATLRSWRSDTRFEPYWATIDHMLGDDFVSFRRRAAALEAAGELEDYDYDAWRDQRAYDLKHAHDHLP
jgi:hypothetical protein